MDNSHLQAVILATDLITFCPAENEIVACKEIMINQILIPSL